MYMEPVKMLIECRGRELCWTGSKIYNFFHDFDKENHVLHEFANTEWIKLCMYNILLNEKKNDLTYIVYEYATIWIKVLLSSHIFSAFEMLYVWLQNEIGYYTFREISPRLTKNIYIHTNMPICSSEWIFNSMRYDPMVMIKTRVLITKINEYYIYF